MFANGLFQTTKVGIRYINECIFSITYKRNTKKIANESDGYT